MLCCVPHSWYKRAQLTAKLLAVCTYVDKLSFIHVHSHSTIGVSYYSYSFDKEDDDDNELAFQFSCFWQSSMVVVKGEQHSDEILWLSTSFNTWYSYVIEQVLWRVWECVPCQSHSLIEASYMLLIWSPGYRTYQWHKKDRQQHITDSWDTCISRHWASSYGIQWSVVYRNSFDDHQWELSTNMCTQYNGLQPDKRAVCIPPNQSFYVTIPCMKEAQIFLMDMHSAQIKATKLSGSLWRLVCTAALNTVHNTIWTN